MKKTLVALAALTAVSAFAQSSVTISGQLDAGIAFTTSVAGVSNTNLNGGQYGANRLRFVGVEDMGGGMKANFHLEMQPGLNGGTSGNGLFNRGAWLGLSGDSWGAVRFGRQGTTTIGLVCTIDQSGCYGSYFGGGILFSGSGSIANNTNPWFAANPTRGGAGQAASTIAGGFGSAPTAAAPGTTTTGAATVTTTGQDVTRVVNAITYLTPNWGGFTGQIQYGLNPGGTAADGATTGISAMYANGPLSLGLAWSSANGTAASPNSGILTTIGGVYNFGVVAVGVGYQKESASTNGSAFLVNFTDATAYAITVMGNLGATKPYLKFGNRTVSGGTFGSGTVAQVATIGTTYDLSKRTKLYLDYAIDTSPGQTGVIAGTNPTQFGFGMQHTF